MAHQHGCRCPCLLAYADSGHSGEADKLKYSPRAHAIILF